MAGVVIRTDILEDKDGKSRGMGTVTFEMPIEAVQAVCILFNCKSSLKQDLYYFMTMLKLFSECLFSLTCISHVQWPAPVQSNHAC